MTETAEPPGGGHEARPAGEPAQAQVDEKTWALLAHLSGLSGFFTSGLGMVLGPLVVWLLGKDKHPFIDRHGKEALNFGITVILLSLAIMLVAFFLFLPMMMFAFAGMFGMFLMMPLILALLVFWVTFVIIAAVKASNGEEYRYPMSLRFVK